MADITKCVGINCPIRDNCYRYTAEVFNELLQSYFVEDNVGEHTNNGFKCDLYWGDNAESIWNDIKEITNN